MSSLPHLGRALTAAGALAGLVLAAGTAVSAPASAAPLTHLVISEAYGGGGNSGATLKSDFVELYNPTSAPISLDGLRLEYFAAANANEFQTGTTACALPSTASVPAGSHYLIRLGAGNGGSDETAPAPDADCATLITMSGTAGRVQLVQGSGTSAALVDRVGWGSAAAKYEGTAPAAGTTSSTSAQRKPDAENVYQDTDQNGDDFIVATPTPKNSGDTGGGGGTPDPERKTIAEIQGPGNASPLVGAKVKTTGVVTANYPTGGFNGFYMQTPGSGAATDLTPGVSDGIFVFGTTDVTVGACYDITGTVTEFNGLTELTNVRVDPAKDGPNSAAPLPVKVNDTLTEAEKEALEGMLVAPQGEYTITNNYQLNQFGQVGLVKGGTPLYTGTDVALPGAAADAVEADNQRRLITLDDGSSWNYMSNVTAKNSPLPYLSQDAPMRTGSQVTFTKPVILDYRFQWNFQPTGQVIGATGDANPVTNTNDREATAPNVGGNVKVASFNVLNYFDDLGKDEPNCTAYNDRAGNPVAANGCQVRGAFTESAFADQQAKIVTAINALGADVVALEEIESSTQVTWAAHTDRDRTLKNLVAALNAKGGNWAAVLSPAAVLAGEDVIRTAFIYNPDHITVDGASQILTDGAFANARYPLAQAFSLKGVDGSSFVAIANHFKSKGSGADDGTGQGLSNPSRIAQAEALTTWADTTFADKPVLLTGDFNAYSKEDPVRIIEGKGYTNLAKKYEPTSATYQFSGRLGSLDHIFANAKANAVVTGAGVWDINGDESIAMQYSRRNYNVTDFHTTSQYASSDHDPVVVGLQFDKGQAQLVTEATAAVEAAEANPSTATIDAARAAINLVAAGATRTALEERLAAVERILNPAPLTSTPTPTITGTAKVGTTLRAVPGTWDDGVKLTYQWKRNGVAIAGATKTWYKLGAADAGKRITVTVTGTKTGYVTVAKTSARTRVVAKGTLTTVKPRISGTGKAGSTLRVLRGSWKPAPVNYSYRWYANGKAIPGATKTTYKVAAKYKGTKIVVKVTGRKAGYVTATRPSLAKSISRR
ncbi:ExeM/NucH family extracellular endonuclease [Kribbia dieselivorans]|uniref:ExeM/NucH family extracellular endonuclease n=1 Tax=Kribbia dieselivorans TaxID=331526 RepID=UPI000A6795C8|nr:ExeM/NucH family extracellular endonuclease [Kribbia dieselivorans]